jgi:hypothetical protein
MTARLVGLEETLMKMKRIRYKWWALMGLVSMAACSSSNPNLTPDDPIMVMRRARGNDAIVVAIAPRLSQSQASR